MRARPRPTRGLGRGLRVLLAARLLLASAFAQGHPDPPTPPLDPVQARAEARALVAEMLAQRPAENATNTGRLLITDEKRQTRTVPVRIETYNHGAKWTTVYEATAAPGAILRVGSELEDVRWFSREQIAHGEPKLPPSQSISYHLIEAWYDRDAPLPLAAVLERKPPPRR